MATRPPSSAWPAEDATCEGTEVRREWIIGFWPSVWIAGVLSPGVSALPPLVPLSLMSQVEYLVALISIIVGLGLTDLAQSFRELIRPGLDVKWDGLPLAWSLFVFFTTLLVWWNGFDTLVGASSAGRAAGPTFLTYLLLFFLLYLCCAFALPDPDWEGSPAGSGKGVDLEAFYFSPEHRRWFFGLLIGFFVVVGVDNQVSFGWDSVSERLESALLVGAVAATTAVPIFTDRRWAHWGAVAVPIGLVGWRVARQILL